MGDLGDGTTNEQHNPVQVSALAGVIVTAVDAGSAHSLALTAGNTVWAWGINDKANWAMAPIPNVIPRCK